MRTPCRNKKVVLGIGNENRGDDQVGLLIARRLQAKGLKGFDILESGGSGTDMLDLFNRYTSVCIVDAVVSGSPPGTIHIFDLSSQPLPPSTLRCSSHQFGLHEAIELARTFNTLPSRLLFYGIEGKDFGFTTEVSHEVESSIDLVAQRIADLLVNEPSISETSIHAALGNIIIKNSPFLSLKM